MSNHPCNHFNRLHFSYIFFSNSLNKLNYTEVLPNLTFNAKCQTFVVFFRSICNWPYELVYRYAVANIQIASLSRQQTTNVFNYTHLHSLSLYIHISTFYHSHLWRFSLLLSVKRIGKKIRAIKCTELPTVEWHQSYLLWSLQTKLNWRIYIYWKWWNRHSNQNFHDFCSVFINNFSNDENIHTFVW